MTNVGGGNGLSTISIQGGGEGKEETRVEVDEDDKIEEI